MEKDDVIPREVYSQINPGTSNSELRGIAESSGIEYSRLWTVRQGLMRRFSSSVSAYSRYLRSKDR